MNEFDVILTKAKVYQGLNIVTKFMQGNKVLEKVRNIREGFLEFR